MLYFQLRRSSKKTQHARKINENNQYEQWKNWNRWINCFFGMSSQLSTELGQIRQYLV